MALPQSLLRSARALRSAARSLHAFEWLVLAQVPAMHLLFAVNGYGWQWWTLGVSLRTFGLFPVGLSLAGILLWALGSALRGRSLSAAKDYLRNLRTREWWILLIRIWLGIILSMHIYVWLKLYVPFLSGRTFDQAIWEAESALLGGYSPNIFLLELFRTPWVLRAVDWAYPELFLLGLYASLLIFPAVPASRLRVACVNAFILLWTAGGWLHVLLPALGPCYWFPSVWKPYTDWLPRSLFMQGELLNNYKALTLFRQAAGLQVHPEYGIAAFPSMHNASQFLLAFWACRFNRYAGFFVLVTAAVIFIGSVVTGWHYITDSVAGAGMAAGCYFLFKPRAGKTPTLPRE